MNKETGSFGKLVILAGSEGSGKSTHAKQLSEDLRIPYVSTGDIIRDKAANDQSDVGDACRDMIAHDAYLDSSLLMKLLSDRLSEDDCRNGSIIDGALRKLEETEKFDEVLQMAGVSPSNVHVIFLRVSGWKGAERRLASKQGRDTEEGVINRITNFQKDLGKRMKIIKKRYTYSQVDANGDWDYTHKKVIEALGL